jgi:hypothetical protein
MTEIDVLRKRRELVLISAGLQRATLVRRFDRIEANPARRVLALAAGAVSTPLLWKVGTAAMGFAVRAYHRRGTRLRR